MDDKYFYNINVTEGLWLVNKVNYNFKFLLVRAAQEDDITSPYNIIIKT